MILEVAVLNVQAAQSRAFEQAFAQAQDIISSMPGYVSHQLQRCIDVSSRYILLVNWRNLEDHTVGFRQSPQYQQWKRLLHHFYDPFPNVEHYEHVFSGGAKQLSIELQHCKENADESNEIRELLPRRELLALALKDAHSDYARATSQASEELLEAHAEPETAILFSWVKELFHEPGWFQQWLAAIAHRGVRSKADRAILTLLDQGVDVAALTDLVTSLQLDVAHGFFGIHSGSYCFALDPEPTLRVTLHYRWTDGDGRTLAAGEFPNAIDDDFATFLFGNG